MYILNKLFTDQWICYKMYKNKRQILHFSNLKPYSLHVAQCVFSLEEISISLMNGVLVSGRFVLVDDSSLFGEEGGFVPSWLGLGAGATFSKELVAVSCLRTESILLYWKGVYRSKLWSSRLWCLGADGPSYGWGSGWLWRVTANDVYEAADTVTVVALTFLKSL